MSHEQGEKIRPTHLSRPAYLYVRQSTLQQVFENTEGKARQYELRGRAVALGWPADSIVVIDGDLGQSGASAVDRKGFQRLVTDVGLGRVGLVMGLEVSRLARKSSDWHRLGEICALADAAAEWRLQGAHLRARHGPPADGVQECVQTPRLVETFAARELHPLEDASPRLQLPDHPQLFSQPLVIDRGQGDEVLGSLAGLLRQVRGQGGALDLGDGEAAAADLDELTLFGDLMGHRRTRAGEETAARTRGA